MPIKSRRRPLSEGELSKFNGSMKEEMRKDPQFRDLCTGSYDF